MRRARIALAIAATAAVLAAGAGAGGVFDLRGAPASGSPVRTTEIAVGDALRVAGQPMQLSLFRTPDPPARVARFYLDAFSARGLLPVTANDPDLAHVSAFDAATGLQRFVSAVPQRDGQTLVLIGTTHPRQPPRFLQGAHEISLPLPPGQQRLLGYRSEDGGARAETAHFVTASTPDEVADFYRRVLRDQGYAERRERAGEGLLLFDRAGATISIALRAFEGRSGAAVFVTHVQGDGAPR